MPGARNQRGGKSYKKMKQGGGGSGGMIPRFEEADDDGSQTYARVTRVLGDRRFLCFCNDGNERICKLRGVLCKGPKKQRVEVGDIVCVSFRDFLNRREIENTAVAAGGSSATADATTGHALTVASGTERKEIADIIGKYDREHWREIRKLPDIHKRLFSDVPEGTGDGGGYDDLFGDDSESDGSIDIGAI